MEKGRKIFSGDNYLDYNIEISQERAIDRVAQFLSAEIVVFKDTAIQKLKLVTMTAEKTKNLSSTMMNVNGIAR